MFSELRCLGLVWPRQLMSLHFQFMSPHRDLNPMQHSSFIGKP